MAKISMFICFFLFVWIAMPTSSSSRMILEEVQEVAISTEKCSSAEIPPAVPCLRRANCTMLVCGNVVCKPECRVGGSR
ncbi:hypothetical protein MKW94_013389 [Papaver nudicaule]|uniref:Uncharacterized protein n=1 Tax=Papaver nudicaule TaxID=74823 RepID=A0AA42AV46_PAPNU|nr:hypothetical protein [Papaver nudicaule]